MKPRRRGLPRGFDRPLRSAPIARQTDRKSERECEYNFTAQEEGDRMPNKKKVYVETTVVNDATALPTRDLVQAGRQLVTREWWNTAR